MSIFIILLIVVSGFLRFYKLDWGEGLLTHPDEYHIIGSVNQLSFPTQMHPHFFSYGTVTIYLIYITKQILQILNHSSLIINTFLIGRFYSALFSTLSIIIVYKICRSFMERRFSYIAALLMGLAPGLIQQAHFATPESTQIFFLLSSLLFMIKFIKQNKTAYIIFASVFFGLALGVKVSSIVFSLPLIITFIVKSCSKNFFLAFFKFIRLALISLTVTAVIFGIVAPYIFIDFPSFRSNLEYEGGLAVGKFPVFYTRQFLDTLPIIFQMEKILPYTLGLSLLLFGVFGFFIVMLNLFQHRNDKGVTLIITVSFLSLFIPNAFLFAKWTRFISLTFPFFAIFAAFFLNKLYTKNRFASHFFTSFLMITTFLWTMAFFSIYTNPDIRITASRWLESYAKEGSSFLVEGGNTVDLPLSGNFQRTSLDLYSLEDNSTTREKIIDSLYSSDYFLIQSRRIFMNHQRLPNVFPRTSNLYNSFFREQMGFHQIKEFHSYPMLKIGNLELEFPDEKAEETWSVFDHPVIRIFEKTEQLSQEDYAKFLEN